MAAPIQALHLVGSASSKWYFDLSVMYARTCMECKDLDRESFTHQAAVIFPSGKWGFATSLDKASLKEVEEQALPTGAAMAKIEAMQPAIDVIVPHMFCVEGLTRYRALCDMLGIEVLGCSAEVCAVAQDKFLTKALCETAGVPVPKGLLLRRDTHEVDVAATAAKVLETWAVPFIVKPAKEDNSFGLSLVKEASVEAIAAALSKAFEYDDTILVEQYIAGREIRVALVEMKQDNERCEQRKRACNGQVRKDERRGGQYLEVLPKIEYVLEDIRDQKYKLGTDANGNLTNSDDDPAKSIAAGKEEGARIYPAQLEPEVHARVDELARKAHKALGCKYYSLYDVRIDAAGMPFMLEAGLFCSFSPYSAIVSLAAQSTAEDIREHPKMFEMMLRRAALETRSRRSPRKAQ